MKRRSATTTTADPATVIPDGYAPLTYDPDGKVTMFDHRWAVQSAGKPYSVLAKPGRVRFEVRQGDGALAEDLGTRDRAELKSMLNHGFGAPVVISCAMRISSGPNPTKWNVLGQFHDLGDAGDGNRSPPWAMELTAGGAFRWMRRWEEGGVYQEDPVALAPAIRGAWFTALHRVVFDPTPNGASASWINGKPVFNLSDVATTYDDKSGPYWKMGIYRALQTAGLSLEYANVEIGGDELLSRIIAPLPI